MKPKCDYRSDFIPSLIFEFAYVFCTILGEDLEFCVTTSQQSEAFGI